MNVRYAQAQSSPRRVAVPVLVKDGKPCSGGGAEASMSRPQHCPQPPHSHHQQQNPLYQRQSLPHQHQPSPANMCASYLPLQGRAW